MKGLWLLPSRRRLTKLQRFFEVPPTTQGVILVQKDELAELGDQYAALTIPANWSILPTNGDGLADKCREVWDAVKDLDWVGLGCDDLRPQTAGWDATLTARITGKNIVTCNDGQQGASRMAGITCFSGGILRSIGYMFPPGFWHTYVDNVWEDIGKSANCWTYIEEVLILHDHPFRDGKLVSELSDDTSNKSYGQQARDLAAYRNWIATERDACIARVKAIQ